MGVPQNGWCIVYRENPMKMENLGGTPILGNHQLDGFANHLVVAPNCSFNRLFFFREYGDPKLQIAPSTTGYLILPNLAKKETTGFIPHGSMPTV